MLHQQTNHGTTTSLHVRFNHQPFRWRINVRTQIFHISHQQDHVQQFIKVLTCLGAHFNHDRIATPFFRVKPVLRGQLRLYQLWVSGVFINLVNRHHNLGISGTCKSDSLYRLRLNTIVSRHHDDHHISQNRSVLPQCSKRFVTRCIKQRDYSAVTLCLIGANVLRDTTSFTLSSLFIQDGVKQARFTVVNVSHNRYDRWARYSFVCQLMHMTQWCICSSRLLALQLHIQAKFFHYDLSGIKIKALVDCCGDTVFEQLTNQRGHG